jgi:hypothetical protein
MPKKKARKGPARVDPPRHKWTRSPVEKVHTTPHGKKGYDRRRVKKELGPETEELGK